MFLFSAPAVLGGDVKLLQISHLTLLHFFPPHCFSLEPHSILCCHSLLIVFFCLQYALKPAVFGAVKVFLVGF